MTDSIENDVAIVGMACQFPGAKNHKEFWQNLTSGKNSIKKIPFDRWDIDKYYSPVSDSKNKSISKWCGLVENIKYFDNQFFNISHLEAKNMDPQQRLLLQEAWHCIEDSAIPLKQLQQAKTSVYVGSMSSDYLQTLSKLEQTNNRYSILGNDHCILANRISHQFNFTGESISINAASASSLVAIHKAKHSLLSEGSDFAIAAGVNLNTDPLKYIVFSNSGMLSPDGQCRSFSDDANGYVPGDGVAVLLMQPLAKAIEQKNQIYGVIKGSAVNHIGSGKAITVPKVAAQAKVVREALVNAGVKSSEINYIETHGSGTPLGDPIEIEALDNVFGKENGEPLSEIVLGSVKPNIGHLEAAAGIAGLIKTLLILKYRQIPMMLNHRKLNPVINLTKTPFKLALQPSKLTEKSKLHAGINSFGFGGVSCHVIIGESTKLMGSSSVDQEVKGLHPHYFLLSAKSKSSLQKNIEQWKAFSQTTEFEKIKLSDVCANLCTGREAFDYRAGLVLESDEDLIENVEKLSLYNNDLKENKSYLFSYDTTQDCYVGEGVKLVFDNYERIVSKAERIILSKEIQINDVFQNKHFKRNLQSLSIYKSLSELNIKPSLVEGVGEGLWPAIICADIIKFDDYLAFIFNKKSIADISYKTPKIPFFNTLQNSIIYPCFIDKMFFSTFINEISNYGDFIKKILDRVSLLMQDNSDFKKTFSVWYFFDVKPLEAGPDVITISTDWLTYDKKELAFVVVAAIDSLNRFYKKWGINLDFEDTPYSLIVIADLIEQGLLSRTDVYKIFYVASFEIEEWINDLNKNHWSMLSQVKSVSKLTRGKLGTSDRESLISLLRDKQALNKADFDGCRVLLGANVNNNNRDCDFSLTTNKGWGDFLLNAWLNGSEVNWQKIYQSNSFDKVSLPGYVFDQKEFWPKSKQEDLNGRLCSVLKSSTKTKTKTKTNVKTQIAPNERAISANDRPKSKEVNNPDISRYKKSHHVIKKTIAQSLLLDVEQVDFTKSFEHYGFDSMGYTELCEKLNLECSLDLTPAYFYEFNNMDKFVTNVADNISLDEPNKVEPLKREDNYRQISHNEVQGLSDIAIVGYSGIMPNAEDLDKFWENLREGVDCISEIPSQRWHWQDFFSKNIDETNKSPSKWGGFISGIEYFDAAFFGISAREAKLMDPQQRLLLQTVWNALEHSGHKPSSFSETKTGVFIGASTSDYEELVRDSELAAHASTGMNRSIIANRISYMLNIHGPSEIIDTACSSSLVAIHKAVTALKNGECDTAIVGGVNALITPTHYISYGKAGMLSPDGRCKTFDSSANGYVRAEGVGVIIIKPLVKALKDRDHVYAVIKGSGVNHGGKANSLTAPNPIAQAQLIYDLYKKENISPGSIDYIENHGTGTPLGDPIEINGLKKAFRDLSSLYGEKLLDNKCYLASVKSNIGHLEAAAGIASVLKVLLALENNTLPAGLHINEINSYINLDDSPFEILCKNTPWRVKNAADGIIIPRRAGISSFGFGGVNAHIVIEEFKSVQDKSDLKVGGIKEGILNEQDFKITKGKNIENNKANTVILSAKTKNELVNYATKFLDYISTSKIHLSLFNIAFTSQLGRDSEKYRLSINASSVDELKESLKNFIIKKAKTTDVNCNFGIVDTGGYNDENIESSIPGKECPSRQTINVYIDKQQISKLAKLWIEGADIDWSLLYKDSVQAMRVALPTYPFNKKYFWVKKEKVNPVNVIQNSDSNISNTNKGYTSNEITRSVVLTKNDFVANEHIVNKKAILPGVYCLELMVSALSNVSKLSDYFISDIFWLKPIECDEDVIKVFIDLKTSLSSIEPNDFKVEIYTLDVAGNKVICAQANIVYKLSSAVGEIVFPDFASTKKRNGKYLYQKLNSIGFEYGDSFRVIEHTQDNSNNYISKAKIPEHLIDDFDRYTIHPCLMDGALQSCLTFLLSRGVQFAYIPMLAEKITLMNKLTPTIYIRVIPLDSVVDDKSSYSFSLQIFGQDKILLAEIKNVVFKRIEWKAKSNHKVDLREEYKDKNNQDGSNDKEANSAGSSIRTRKSDKKFRPAKLYDGEQNMNSPKSSDRNNIKAGSTATQHTVHYNMENNTVNTDVLLDKTIEYFTTIIADAASMPKNELDVTQPFKEYGIDSFLTLSIIRNLEAEFGNLRKTLLFETTNVVELSNLFIKEHQGKMLDIVGMKPGISSETIAENADYQEELTEKISNKSSGSNDNENKPLVIDEHELSQLPDIQKKVSELFLEYGRESIALSRKDIAPKLFIGKRKQGFFYFNIYRNLLLAFRYVGSDEYFEEILFELSDYCEKNQLLVNVLAEQTFAGVADSMFSANSFAVVQRIPSLESLTLGGGRMRRLRYYVKKFEQSGSAKTIEYKPGSDSSTDDAIGDMIERWASLKSGVNPYIWRVRDDMATGCLSDEYRVYLTLLDGSLQNVVIISRVDSDNGYLLDTEFYSNEMAIGGLEFAIWKITQYLKNEGCTSFSLGLTFGSEFSLAPHSDPEVRAVLENLSEDNIFNESGNYQFKNKYRCVNSPMYLYRPSGQSASNITDIIMMIGNPHSFKKEKVQDRLIDDSPIVEGDKLEFKENESVIIVNKGSVKAAKSSIQEFDDTVPNSERIELLKKAKYNPLSISRQKIEFDLVTDSWSELEFDYIKQRMQYLYAQKSSGDELEQLLAEIFSLPYISVFSSGRVAESFFCSAWSKKKKHIIQNVLFPTCLFHQFDNDFLPIEITNSEFTNTCSESMFKGDIDCQELQRKLAEYKDDVAFIWIELANNATGGCPVSISNLRQIKGIIGEIPLVLDATRIVENAYYIAQYEEEYIGKDIWLIITEICHYADAINASLTKDFCTPIGGFFATNNLDLHASIQDSISTNGSGLSRFDRELLCTALKEREHILSEVANRVNSVQSLAQVLISNNMKVVQPVGGHCILLDPFSIKELSALNYPLQSFLAWLFKETGIRAGVHSVGRQSGTPMNNLIRLAVPVGLSNDKVKEIGQRLVYSFTKNSKIDNLHLVNRPQGLFGDLKASYGAKESVNLHLSSTKEEKEEKVIKEVSLSADDNQQGSNNRKKKLPEKTKRVVKDIELSGKTKDIAIIGVSGRYPQADSLGQFWDNLSNGKNSIIKGPDWRKRFVNENSEQHWGGFIKDVDKFDSLFFSISPREAKNMDPQERLMMEVAWETLEDAGYYPQSLIKCNGSNNIGVFFGAVWSHYEMLGAENRQNGGVSIANSQHWGISNRVSSFMNFGGPSLTVDTACSSSLTAIHLACESLRNGECEVALAGGVNLDLHPGKYHITKSAQFLSDDGLCRAFGKGGSGYVAGEGVGSILLKPLAQAIKDGDQIYGVIKSSAINHGGRTSGYTVPSPNAQAELITKAIKQAGISAETISYIEAHGTGTELGDPIEIEAAAKAFRIDTNKKQFCSIGSVKTNIGHLEAAAGIAGVTKLLLQMKHKRLVPSLHSSELNEHIDFPNTPFYMQQVNQPWESLTFNGKVIPRRAGLSSFGAGGTNVHIIFEEYKNEISRTANNDSVKLIILSAKNPENLKDYIAHLYEFINQESNNNRQVDLDDLAYTLQVGRLPMTERIAFVISNQKELLNKLDLYLEDSKVSDPSILASSKASKMALDLFNGKESGEILQVFINNGSLNKIAKLWVNGVDVDWLSINKYAKARKISLPTYPFSKESHWIEVVNRVTESISPVNSNQSLHPLLDFNCSTFELQEYSKKFNLQQFVFRDHIVDQLPTLPGVAYMEMAIAAAQFSSKRIVAKLRNMIWASPINTQGPADIRIRLTNKSETINFDICTFDSSDNKSIHSQGKVICKDYNDNNGNVNEEAIKTDLESVRRRCKNYVSKEDCYDLLATRKLTYGNKLKSITGFYYGDKEGLTCLELPQGLDDTFNEYFAHPSLLDGAVQSIISLLEFGNAPIQVDVPYVPFVLNELTIVRPLTKICFAHLTLNEGEKERDDIKRINIDLIDESGNLLVRMKDFSFKAVSGVTTGRINDDGNLKQSGLGENIQKPVVHYKPGWQKTSDLQVNVARGNDNQYLDSNDNAILLFDSDTHNRDCIKSRLVDNSATVIFIEASDRFNKINRAHYQINLQQENDYSTLLESLISDGFTPNKIIHNWSRKEYQHESDFIIDELNKGLYSVFLLSKALLKNKNSIDSKIIELLYLYHGSETQAQPLYSATNGFIRSIKQEGANFNCKTIEVENNKFLTDREIMFHNVLLEFKEADDCEIAYRDTGRYVKKLMSFDVNSKLANNRNVVMAKADGIYLITGGAGGLGMIFARELIRNAKVTIILTGRRAADTEIENKLKSLTTLGANVAYVKCDLSQEQEVKSLFNSIIAKHNRIDGIIHAAGVIKDAFLWNKTKEQFTQVLAPKVIATHYLDLVSKDIKLDYFVMFSSIASTNGNMGQSDYAAGNRFMDEFSSLRQRLCVKGKRSGKTLSLNWPLWRDGGMQVSEQAEKWLLENWGMKPLATDFGIAALHNGLNLDLNSFGLVEGETAKIYKALDINRQEETRNVENITSASTKVSSPQIEITKATSLDSISERLKVDLKQMVMKLLKIKQADVKFAENMSNYGFDSVTFTEFGNLINSQLELDITPLIFFEQETLDELTEYLLDEFTDQLTVHYGKESQVESSVQDFDNKSYETDAATIPKNQENQPKNIEVGILSDENYLNIQEQSANEPIAIIGMSGIMPQSPDLDSFWDNLINEKNLITEIPKDRWDWRKFYGESDLGNNKTKIKWGGFIPEIDKFDAEFFNISPLEAELTDPQQRLFLQTVWHTVEDSGYKASELSGTNTGVFVGIGTSDYHELLREQNSEFEAYSVMGWMHAVLANRISYFFNWKGPSEPIGTACSSSLVAIDRAVQAIRSKKCDMCVAGGISLIINPGLHIGLGKAEMLSPDGQCKTFDHQANGYVRSEGVGAILLKPLSKAKADGDNIYAVIKGSAVNHGGHVNTFTTPNPKAQTEVLTMAFQDAEIDPATLTYIEAHGTGTALGDPIEIQGLLKAFKQSAIKKADMPEVIEYCALGSVKTNAGHLELAAGMAGIFKLLLSLKHKTIPASINFEKINPYIKLANTPFRIADTTQEWRQLSDIHGNLVPRRAGISSFGFGGVNAHIILEEQGHQEYHQVMEYEDGQSHVITLSVKHKEGLIIYAKRLVNFINRNQIKDTLPSLSVLASGLLNGREAMPIRLAFVVQSIAELKQKLHCYLNNTSTQGIYENVSEAEIQDILRKDDLEQLYRVKKVNSLAMLWVSGMDINWPELYPRKQKVSLPNYPFQQNRYWLLDSTRRGAIEQHCMVQEDLLSDAGIQLYLLDSDKQDGFTYEFKIVFEQSSIYLKSHNIANLRLLPAASYLEIVNYGLIKSEDVRIAHFYDVFWFNPITQEAAERDIRLVIVKNNDSFDFSICSPGNNNVMNYCQGSFDIKQSKSSSVDITLDKKKYFNNIFLDRVECYQEFSNRGFDYGESLTIINNLYTDKDEILAELVLPDCFAGELGERIFHTSIVDGALQSILGILIFQSAGEKIQVPVSASNIQWLKPLTLRSYVKIKELKQIKSSVDDLSNNLLRLFDIFLFDDNGDLTVAFKGLEIRPLKTQENANIISKKIEKNAIENNESYALIFERTVDFLSQLIADETRRDRDTIKASDSFESFGIDSFLALRMTKKLEKSIGPVNKTTFFEYSTLQSLVDYLVGQYTSELASLFEIEEAPLDSSRAEPLEIKQTNRNSHQLIEQTIDFLAQLIANETRKERSSINTTDNFESYGIDSFLALRMTKQLEKSIGPVTKTAFFEHTTLQSLADYLLIQYQNEFASLFDLDKSPVSEGDSQNDNVVSQPEAIQTGNHNNQLYDLTVNLLAQLIADETRRARDSIKATDSFESYGIDSFLALRMTKKLEKSIGPVSKMAFFENTTLKSLTDYLLLQFPNELEKLFDLNNQAFIEPENMINNTDVQPETILPDSSQSGTSQSTNNNSHLVNQTIGFLAQLVADETKRSRDSIRASDSFESYGIDSFLALRMTRKLEKAIGPLSKTAFFEYRNINDFARFLTESHSKDLVEYFDLDQMASEEIINNNDEFNGLNVGYGVFQESEILENEDVQLIIANLSAHFGKENNALARNTIAPLIFLGSSRKAYFNFNHNDSVALAFTYVGSDNELEGLTKEFVDYCRANHFQPNILTEKQLSCVQGENFSSNSFGMMQRMNSINNLSLKGRKMRRLRYQISKFESCGECCFDEWFNGEDHAVDKSIANLIDSWASTKKMVNPYIWKVKDTILEGRLPKEHRIFITRLNNQLQNVIIITQLTSGNGYLMDLEFYHTDMPLGGLEYSIWNILQLLSEEKCDAFSLGATFGVLDGDKKYANTKVSELLFGLQQQGAFDGQGNLQFKNKFRPDNTTLYLSRPSGDDADKVVDVIMMIANPTIDNVVIEQNS